MAIVWTEQWEPMASTYSGERFFYGVSDSGAESLVTAYTALLAQSPTSLGALLRTDAQVKELEGHDDEWYGVVRYASPEFGTLPPLAIGQRRIRFSTRGGTQRITQSIDTIGDYGKAGAAGPEHYGAINVSARGVEGVDIGLAAYTFNITKVFANADITTAFKADLARITYRVNNATFEGLAAGECLFLGVEGGPRSETDHELDFAFAASPNRTANFVVNPSAPVGDQITVVSPWKLGWEYLWLEYEHKDDAVAKVTVKRPIAAHVEKVYELDNFALLNAGP